MEVLACATTFPLCSLVKRGAWNSWSTECVSDRFHCSSGGKLYTPFAVGLFDWGATIFTLLVWFCFQKRLYQSQIVMLSPYAAVGASGCRISFTTLCNAWRSLAIGLIEIYSALMSSSTCFSHVYFGTVRWILHWMGRFRQRSWCGSLLASIWHKWPNHRNRRFWICSSIGGWLSYLCRMSSFWSRSQSDIRNICWNSTNSC